MTEVLAALTAEGYAVVKIPEGLAVDEAEEVLRKHGEDTRGGQR